MICQCRLATLRTFLNGLAQVHKIEAFPASSQLFTLPKRSAAHAQAQAQNLRNQTQTRGLHGSTHLAAQQNGDSGSQPRQKVKMRWRDLPVEELKAKMQKRDGLERKIAARAKKEEVPEGAQQKKAAPRKFIGTAKTSTTSKANAATTGPKASSKKNNNPSRQSEHDAADPESRPKKEDWAVQKARLKEKFPEGWKPRKRLSPDALAGLRALNAQFPDVYTTEALAAKFEMSAEAVRRILRSKWQPDEGEEKERHDRWHRRGMQIWETKAALGVKPPRKWRAEGITRDPSYHQRRRARIQRDQEWEEEEIRKYREYREGLQKAAKQII